MPGVLLIIIALTKDSYDHVYHHDMTRTSWKIKFCRSVFISSHMIGQLTIYHHDMTKSRGPDGLQLEVGAQGAPRLPYFKGYC